MANNSITPSKIRRKLIDIENEYYEVAAEYVLCLEGVKNPSKQQIVRFKKYLFKTYFDFSLTFRERIN